MSESMRLSIPDAEPLADFARTRSPDAFAAIVRRYAGLVHSTACRMVGDTHIADDVTQATFIVLVRKADRLDPRTLPGWLVNTTRLAAKAALRSQRTRDKHETRAAQMRSQLQSEAEEPTADELLPLLDEALAHLSETDRSAVVLRFLQGLTFAEVGAATGATEESARKRVGRAVEKLRAVFMKQGLTPSVGGLMLVLAAQQAPPASAAMTAAATAAVATGGTASSALLAKAAVLAMTRTKAKLAVSLLAMVLLGIGIEMVQWSHAGSPTTGSVAPVLTAGAAGASILVLDDCDDRYDGKAEYRDSLTLVNSQGRQAFRVSGFNNCESIGSSHMIATDRIRNCVWVIENAARRLRRFDLTGKETLTISGIDGTAIAVDPEAGNIWTLANAGKIDGGKTVVFDDKGKRVASYDISGWDIVYDTRAKAFWIAGRNLTKVTPAQGKVLFSAAICPWCASSTDVDAGTGAVWVTVREHPDVFASSNRLLKFDTDGNELLAVELGQKSPFRVSVDPKDGSVWVAQFMQSVERFSAEGKSEAQYPLAALTVQVVSGGDLWVVTPAEIQELSAKGDVLRRLPLAGKTSQAWIAPLD